MHEGTELMFNGLDESVRRCLNISRFDEKNSNVVYLASKFLEYFGGVLLIMLVDFGSQIVPDLSRKVELNESFFEIIFKLNSLTQRVEISMYKSTKDIIKDKKYEQLIEKKEKILNGLERKIERIIQKAIASLIIHVNRLLVASQEKGEYNIRGKEPPAIATNACVNFVDFLKPYINQIQCSYSENIRRRILSLLGSQIIGVLMDHYSEVKVTIKGAVIVAADLDEYERIIDDFDDAHTTKEFETLKLLTHIYRLESKDVDTYIKLEEGLKEVPSAIMDKFKYNRG